MDIKVKRTYYYRKMTDGKYHIFLREEIVSKGIQVTDLPFLASEYEDEAKQIVDILNEGVDEELQPH